MSVIKLENVSKYYKSTDTVSMGMQKVNLEFNMGEFVGVTGESGSGKSTLLNVISGLDKYEEGELYLFDEETSHFTISDWEKYRSAYVGFVFQNYNIIDSYTVLQNVLLALEIQGYDPKKKKERALELIDKVGLSSHIHHKASKLSGGQKQRAVIARALAKDCPIIVADEPTGNLDSKSAAQVISLLHDISKDKLVIVVTHDFEVIEPYATRKIKMHDGEVVEDKFYDKPDTTIAQIEEPTPKKMRFVTLLKFAFRNLLSTPKKTFFIVMMQVIIMLAFTLLYATIQSSIVNNSTSNLSANINVPETRMLVEKRDGSDLTDSDYDYLRNISEVESVYEKSLNFYNDIELHVFNLDALDGEETSYYSYVLANYEISGTDAASILGSRTFDGTMPVESDEIIIDDPYDEFNIGDSIVLAGRSYFDSETQLMENAIQEFTITGITHNVHGDDLSKGYIYFSDTFLEGDFVPRTYEDEDYKNMVMEQIYDGHIEVETSMIAVWNIIFMDEAGSVPKISFVENDEDIFTGLSTIEDITIHAVFYDFYNWQGEGFEYTLTIEDVEVYKNYANLNAVTVFANDVFLDKIIEQQLIELENVYLITARDAASLSVDSQSAGNRVLDRIDTDIYRVYYPANVPAPTTIDVIFLTYFYNGLLIVFGLLLYLIVYAVSKNTMRSRSKDFAIYRSIGAQKTVVARLVLIEQIMTSLAGIVFMLITMNVIALFSVQIATYLTILTFSNFVFLFSVFILFGVWLGLRFNKRIFNQSVIENINLSKEVN